MKKAAVFLMVITLVFSLMVGTVLAKPNNSNLNKEQIKTNVKKNFNAAPEHQQKIKEALGSAIIAGDYSDTKTHWSSQAVKKAKALGLVKGYEDGSFRPDASISTLEVTAVAVRLAETLGTDIIEDTASDDGVIAVPTVPEWAQDSVKKANALKIINFNRYHSQVQANRAQAAIMLAKALKLAPVVATEVPFPDVGSLSAEDLGYLLALQQAGIIKGSPDGKFNPNSSLTRAEIATMLARIAEQATDNTGGTTTTGDTLTTN